MPWDQNFPSPRVQFATSDWSSFVIKFCYLSSLFAVPVVSLLPKFPDSLKRRFSGALTMVQWLLDAAFMCRFVRQAPLSSIGADAQLAAIVVTPWFGSAVPWFSIALGMLLAVRGYRVSFVLDDMIFGKDSSFWRLQLICIHLVLAVVGCRHPVLRLSNFSAAGKIDTETYTAIERLAHLNAIWARKGETGIDLLALRNSALQLLDSQKAITSLLNRHPQDFLFVPGGICLSSGLWLRSGRLRGLRVSTYDSGGYGLLLLAADGIACQLQDIPRAYAELHDQIISTEERQLVIGYAEEEIRKRRVGIDRFSSQVKSVSVKRLEYEGAILIALNSPWDSAALGLHTVFASTQEWIIQTVRYVLENSEAPVLVRQHPVERLPSARSVDDTRALLDQYFGDNPRVHFISADDPVNTYDLIDQAAAVVVNSSTVGLEAVAYGRPVVTESSSYYARLGFVLYSETTQNYFGFIEDAIAGKCIVTTTMREDALFCYYITQCCNWLQTSFTVSDFPIWSRRLFVELASDPTVDSVVTSVATNMPVSLINHHRRWASISRSVAKVVSNA